MPLVEIDYEVYNEILKKQVNQLQVENADLQAEVVKLRYSPHIQEVRNSQQVYYTNNTH